MTKMRCKREYYRNIQKSIFQIAERCEATIDMPNQTLYVKSYRHNEFADIREHFGITITNYMRDIIHENIIYDIDGKEAKFTTASHTFLIKKISKNERKRLSASIITFKNHYIKQESTYLTRYLGLYSISYSTYKSKEYFVVCNASIADRYLVDFTMDLKGCSLRRTNLNGIYCDNLWDNQKFKLHLNNEMHKVIDRIFSTTLVLYNHNIYNYSLRIGVCRGTDIQNAFKRFMESEDLKQHNIADNKKFNFQYSFSDKMVNGQEEVYIFEITNAIEEWSWAKGMEYFINRVYYSGKRSCMYPYLYRERFLHMIMKRLFKGEYRYRPMLKGPIHS